jgi:hypothetical protein
MVKHADSVARFIVTESSERGCYSRHRLDEAGRSHMPNGVEFCLFQIIESYAKIRELTPD